MRVFYIILTLLLLSPGTAYSEGPPYFTPSEQFISLRNTIITEINLQAQTDRDLVLRGDQFVRYNRDMLANGGSQRDMRQMPPGLQAARDREQLRNDDCLGGAEGQNAFVRDSYRLIKTRLVENITQACNAERAEHVCNAASETARISADEISRLTENAMSHRSPQGAVEYARNHKQKLIDTLHDVQQANISCEQAIQADTGSSCVETFYTVFDSNFIDLLSRLCTASGASAQFSEFEELMNRRDMAPHVLQRISVLHIQNRENEALIAAELGTLSQFLARIEQDQAARVPASDGE